MEAEAGFQAKFRPVEPGPACLESIMASDHIINDVLERVALGDEMKEGLSKKRAVKLAISTAWLTAAFNKVSKSSIQSLIEWMFNCLLCLVIQWEALKAGGYVRADDLRDGRGGRGAITCTNRCILSEYQ